MNATATLADPTPLTPSAGLWSAADVVRPLSPDQKQDLLVALLRDLMTYQGENGLIVIDSLAGDPVGYFTPQAAMDAAFRRHRAQLPPEVRAELERPVGDLDWDKSYTFEEMEALIAAERAGSR